jgi:hypothetical protein
MSDNTTETNPPLNIDALDFDVQMDRDRKEVRGVIACLSITNMVVVPSMSEETVAFTCKVKMGKVVIAHAKNDGHGGNTFVWAAEGKREMLDRVLAQWAKCIGPDHVTHSVRFDFEAWLDEAAAAKLKQVEDKREETRIRKWISTRVNKGSVVFRVGDEWACISPNLGAIDAPRSKAKWEAIIKKEHPGAGPIFFPSWWVA